jgi:hypothetical protein
MGDPIGRATKIAKEGETARSSGFGNQSQRSSPEKDHASGDRQAEPAAAAQEALPKEESALEQEETLEEVDDPETKDPRILTDGRDMTEGAKLTLTFNDGLVVQILPNGDTLQQKIRDAPLPKNLTKG